MKSQGETLDVVVIGGGYGGLEIIRTLHKHREFRKIGRLTLIDKENFFLFTPLLPDIASGSVGTRHIVYPLRSFCTPKDVRFIKNKLRAVDPKSRRIHLHGGLTISYDYLFLSLGAQVNFYGVPGAKEHCFPLKSVMDAIRIRAQVIEMFELAEQAQDNAMRNRLLTFVVIGGGLTGVEIASEMMQLIQDTMLKRYPGIPKSLITVYLVEHEPRLMPQVREEHGRLAEQHLRRLGVNVIFHRRVVAVHDDGIELDDGGLLPAHTGIWTAGIRGCSPEKGWPGDFPLTSNGKIRVTDEGRVSGHPRIFVVGDLAAFPDVRTGQPVPAVAQGAIQGGRVAAKNLLADIDLSEPAHLEYLDYGYIVGLGKRSSVAHFFGITISGWLGWYVWAFVYLTKMVGARKQLEVMIDHIKGFFFERDISQIYDRRLILKEGDVELQLAGETGQRMSSEQDAQDHETVAGGSG